MANQKLAHGERDGASGLSVLNFLKPEPQKRIRASSSASTTEFSLKPFDEYKPRKSSLFQPDFYLSFLTFLFLTLITPAFGSVFVLPLVPLTFDLDHH